MTTTNEGAIYRLRVELARSTDAARREVIRAQLVSLDPVGFAHMADLAGKRRGKR